MKPVHPQAPNVKECALCRDKSGHRFGRDVVDVIRKVTPTVRCPDCRRSCDLTHYDAHRKETCPLRECLCPHGCAVRMASRDVASHVLARHKAMSICVEDTTKSILVHAVGPQTKAVTVWSDGNEHLSIFTRVSFNGRMDVYLSDSWDGTNGWDVDVLDPCTGAITMTTKTAGAVMDQMSNLRFLTSVPIRAFLPYQAGVPAITVMFMLSEEADPMVCRMPQASRSNVSMPCLPVCTFHVKKSK